MRLIHGLSAPFHSVLASLLLGHSSTSGAAPSSRLARTENRRNKRGRIYETGYLGREFCECFSILRRSHAIQAAEETAEMVCVRKVQSVSNFLDLKVGIEEQLHGLLVQAAFDVGLGTHAGIAGKGHGESVQTCAARPGQFFNAQIRGQFVFDQVEDVLELRMSLEVPDDDVIQVGDG